MPVWSAGLPVKTSPLSRWPGLGNSRLAKYRIGGPPIYRRPALSVHTSREVSLEARSLPPHHPGHISCALSGEEEARSGESASLRLRTACGRFSVYILHRVHMTRFCFSNERARRERKESLIYECVLCVRRCGLFRYPLVLTGFGNPYAGDFHVYDFIALNYNNDYYKS